VQNAGSQKVFCQSWFRSKNRREPVSNVSFLGSQHRYYSEYILLKPVKEIAKFLLFQLKYVLISDIILINNKLLLVGILEAVYIFARGGLMYKWFRARFLYGICFGTIQPAKSLFCGPGWIRTSDPTYIGSVPVRIVFYLILCSNCEPSGLQFSSYPHTLFTLFL